MPQLPLIVICDAGSENPCNISTGSRFYERIADYDFRVRRCHDSFVIASRLVGCRFDRVEDRDGIRLSLAVNIGLDSRCVGANMAESSVTAHLDRLDRLRPPHLRCDRAGPSSFSATSPTMCPLSRWPTGVRAAVVPYVRQAQAASTMPRWGFLRVRSAALPMPPPWSGLAVAPIFGSCGRASRM